MRKYVVIESGDLERTLNDPPKGDAVSYYVVHSWTVNVYGNSYTVVWEKKDYERPFSIGPM